MKIIAFGLSWVFIVLLAFLLGCFQYGSIRGGSGIVLLSSLLTVLGFVGLVPILGVGLYFWMNFVFALVYTVFVLLIIYWKSRW